MAAQLQALNQPSTAEIKEFLSTYNKITEQCFGDCVNDFSKRTLTGKESDCSTNCLYKYLKSKARIAQRFEEFQIQQNEALAAQTGFLKKPGT